MYRTEAKEDRSVLVVAFNNRLYGLDRRTGARRWEHALAGFAEEVEIAVVKDRVYATNGHVLARYEYPSGAEIGQTPLPVSYRSRPTMLVEGELIYIASNGNVVCCSHDGDVLWHDPFSGKGLGSVALGFPGNVRQADDDG